MAVIPVKIFLVLAGLLSPCLAIKCYRDLDGEPKDCETTGRIVNKVQGKVAGVWKWLKDGIQHISGDDWIDEFGELIKDKIGVDITSSTKNRQWVQDAMDKLGVDFDVSGNCYVTFEKASKTTLERGCGALGGAGTLGAELIQFIQGKQFNFLAGSVCFTKPGSSDKEVCLCSTEACNNDPATALRSVGVRADAKSAECGGEECPLANLTAVNSGADFNSACVTFSGPPSREMCYSTQAVLIPEAAKLTRSNPKADAENGEGTYTLNNIDGETTPFEKFQGFFGYESGASYSTVSATLMGVLFVLGALIFN